MAPISFTSAAKIGAYLPDEKSAKDGDVLTANLVEGSYNGSLSAGYYLSEMVFHEDYA